MAEKEFITYEEVNANAKNWLIFLKTTILKE